ncbi:hypothetical protein HH212_16735 [Massilia forsythiae]|uniref:Uncharacterized protein n=1 Tax=Massilia forsythiae TaxID=2728020 RepID=A0A7Z2VY99_9BURK|nr:hypothetical protein [Massilia forsythiae]QJE01476.1 hypothetical protein HH212_16735 [Massilia forsythiae]
MRDKKDNATFDLPGLETPARDEGVAVADTDAHTDAPKRATPRPRRVALKQEQLQLLEETDTSGLPVWKRDPNLDLTGLPIWQPA